MQVRCRAPEQDSPPARRRPEGRRRVGGPPAITNEKGTDANDMPVPAAAVPRSHSRALILSLSGPRRGLIRLGDLLGPLPLLFPRAGRELVTGRPFHVAPAGDHPPDTPGAVARVRAT